MQAKRVLVVGGTSGMGRATAETLVAQEAEVVVASRSATDHPVDGAYVYNLDATDPDAIAKLFAQQEPFHHVVVSIGGGWFAPFRDMTLKQARAFFDRKFWGSYAVARAAVNKLHMDGSIVFVSGVAAEQPWPNLACGAAINGALNALTRSLAVELAPIRVNTVAPGLIATPAWERATPEDRANAWQRAEEFPLKRPGKPEEIAQGILFLLQCGYITGQIITIDGGFCLV